MPTRLVAVLSAVSLRRYVPGIVRYARPDTSVWQLDLHADLDRARNLIREWEPSGLILEHVPGLSDPLLELGIPTVTVHYDFPDTSPHGWVDVNDREVGRSAAAFFTSKRLRHLAFYGLSTQWSEQRLAGFRESLATLGIEPHTLLAPDSGPHRYSEYWPSLSPELLAWLRALPKPVGILAAHDPLGRALIEACAVAGIDIPREVAVLGVNDDPLVCPLSQPPLSSVRVPWQRLGYELMEILDGMLAGRPAESRVISPGTIGERLSTDVLAVDHPLVRRALDLIRQHITEGINVVDLTHRLGCSRRHLERLFRDHLGRSPKDEITFRQLAIARDLLLNTRMKISAVAAEAGFQNVERFYSLFRRVEGLSPGAYRRQAGRRP